jgi:DNA-binding transcriptional LysR family regulator
VTNQFIPHGSRDLSERGRPVVPLDLLRHSCIRVRLPNGAPYRWPFEKDGQSLQVEVDGPITLDEASLSRMAALEGAGIAFVMRSDVREDVKAGRLETVLDDWMQALPPLALYYPGRRHPSAAFKAFVNLARDFTRLSTADG